VAAGDGIGIGGAICFFVDLFPEIDGLSLSVVVDSISLGFRDCMIYGVCREKDVARVVLFSFALCLSCIVNFPLLVALCAR
jgi:hypothetical protein